MQKQSCNQKTVDKGEHQIMPLLLENRISKGLPVNILMIPRVHIKTNIRLHKGSDPIFMRSNDIIPRRWKV